MARSTTTPSTINSATRSRASPPGRNVEPRQLSPATWRRPSHRSARATSAPGAIGPRAALSWVAVGTGSPPPVGPCARDRARRLEQQQRPGRAGSTGARSSIVSSLTAIVTPLGSAIIAAIIRWSTERDGEPAIGTPHVEPPVELLQLQADVLARDRVGRVAERIARRSPTGGSRTGAHRRARVRRCGHCSSGPVARLLGHEVERSHTRRGPLRSTRRSPPRPTVRVPSQPNGIHSVSVNGSIGMKSRPAR